MNNSISLYDTGKDRKKRKKNRILCNEVWDVVGHRAYTRMQGQSTKITYVHRGDGRCFKVGGTILPSQAINLGGGGGGGVALGPQLPSSLVRPNISKYPRFSVCYPYIVSCTLCLLTNDLRSTLIVDTNTASIQYECIHNLSIRKCRKRGSI